MHVSMYLYMHVKKSGLDKEQLKHYRPISNLPFLSKLLEKVVERRLEIHLRDHMLHDVFQSAYRTGHSTETALLRVFNDITEPLDQKCMVILVMLDLSAAFDVIDHDILLKRVEYSYGITADALSWIQSYLKDRIQCVSIGNETSSDKVLNFSVPQGSVLGPRKYCMFSKPIGEIVRRHNLQYHCYADDSQVYMSIKPTDNLKHISSTVEACVADISTWMSNKMLKVNQDKTEMIIFRPKQQTNTSHDMSIIIGGNILSSSSSVKNLGVYMDSALTMEKQVNAVTKSCYYQIRNIGHTRHYISNEACKVLVHSLVTSRLDYGNAVLYGIPQTLSGRLQRVQNYAARLITRTRKREHITPVLCQLHWLPVLYRSHYKILLYTYTDTEMIPCGVPQGSVLGPLLFIIYTNDLPNCLKYSKAILFADDTTIYLSSSDIHYLYKTVNIDLGSMTEWFRSNKLSLNVSKTHAVMFKQGHMNIPSNLNVKIGNQIIERKNVVKFLGIYIDSKLEWHDHINYINNKLKLYAMIKIKHLLNRKHLLTLYYALIYPYLDYGITLWGSTHNSYIKTLFVKQKKAIRIITGAKYNEHTTPLFKDTHT